MSGSGNDLYKFGEFRYAAAEKVLWREDKPVSLTPKAVALLGVLVINHGRIVEKDELMRAVWADSFVEEGNLAFNIRQLRKTLGENARNPVYIETVPRRGYRFIAAVERFAENEKNPIQSTNEIKSPVLPAHLSARHLPQTVDLGKTFFKKMRTAVFALAVLLVGAAAFNWWYKDHRKVLGAPILSKPFSTEKLSDDGNVFAAALSPDGKTVVYTKRVGNGKESVWLRELDTGNNIEIVPPEKAAYYSLAFSPDGNFVYFCRKTDFFSDLSHVYRVSIFGGVPTKIIDRAEGKVSISSDGAHLAFVRCPREENENCALWIADINGKNERKLTARARPLRIAAVTFAPDNKSIAFAVGQSKNAANEFAFARFDLESGTESELSAQRFFNIRNLAWLPDQSGLLVTASRVPNKHFRIWQIDFAADNARPLTRDSETYDVFAHNTKNGQIYGVSSNSVLSASQGGQSVKLFKIEKNLLTAANLIKTQTRLTNYLGFEYDFYSTIKNQVGNIKLISYDRAAQTIKIPVIIPNERFQHGKVTDRSIVYKFNGTYFVKAK